MSVPDRLRARCHCRARVTLMSGSGARRPGLDCIAGRAERRGSCPPPSLLLRFAGAISPVRTRSLRPVPGVSPSRDPRPVSWAVRKALGAILRQPGHDWPWLGDDVLDRARTRQKREPPITEPGANRSFAGDARTVGVTGRSSGASGATCLNHVQDQEPYKLFYGRAANMASILLGYE